MSSVRLQQAWWRAKYWRARRRSRLAPEPRVDAVYLVAAQNRGWILDRFARELAARPGASRAVMYTDAPDPPAARVIFYTHFTLFLAALARGLPASQRAVVFVTHVVPTLLDEAAFGLRWADAVVCMNSATAADLTARGVPASTVHVAPGAADAVAFTPDWSRRQRRVLLSSAFYARKAPDTIAQLVEACPTESFRLVGRGWRDYPGFPRLTARTNFEYLEVDYSRYPAVFNECDVFVSVSHLEGGPIPLLEAMMCDLPPVATRTGFAPDIIRHEHNGYLIDPGAALDALAPLIDRARRLREIRPTVLAYSWPSFTTRVNGLIDGLAAAEPPSRVV